MSRENEIRSVTCPHCLIWRGSPVAFGGHVQWDCHVIIAKRAGAHRAQLLVEIDGLRERLEIAEAFIRDCHRRTLRLLAISEIGRVDGHRET